MISRARFRRRIATAIALIATAAVIVTGTTTSLASWTDSEYVNGSARSMLCTDAGSGASTGSGRLIGGQLGALDLDAVAAIAGESVGNAGTGSTPTPSDSTSLGGDAYANPLTVSALTTINASLGGAMVVPTGADAGALNQWARAKSDTTSAGAAGAVLNTGALSLTPPADGAGLPRFATVKLGTVLQSVLGSSVSSLVTNLTDVDLGIGAVASDATLDACRARWNGIYTALVRQYALAGLEAVLTSPTAGALATDANTTLTTLSSSITTVAGGSGLATSLSSAILGDLGSVLNGLGTGSPTVTTSITPDFSAVTALLTGTVSDADHLVSISPSAGTITLDLDALLGPAYLSSPAINGLAPNSRLLINAAALGRLETAVGTALASWVTSVTTAITSALAAVTVHVKLTVPITAAVLVGTVDAGTLVVETTASLASLLAGTAVVDVHIDQSAGLLCSLLPSVCTLLTNITGLLTGTVTAAVGPVIGGVVGSQLSGLNSTVTALGATLGADSSTLVTFLGTSMSAMFGSTGLVSLTANAQNLPDPAIADAGMPPTWAAGLPGATTTPYGTGRFDVAALRLVVAGALPTVALGLDLARSSVGSNTAVG